MLISHQLTQRDGCLDNEQQQRDGNKFRSLSHKFGNGFHVWIELKPALDAFGSSRQGNILKSGHRSLSEVQRASLLKTRAEFGGIVNEYFPGWLAYTLGSQVSKLTVVARRKLQIKR